MARTPLVLSGDETRVEVPLYTGHLTGQLEDHLRLVARNKLADTITGGLAKPGKMPCPSIGLPASRCKVGSALEKVEGSVCHPSVCYAKKRNYSHYNVQKKLEERYQGLFHKLWTPALIFLVNYYCDEYFRLFDSGDIQSPNHLKNIVTLAQHVPHVKVWMPTREIETVRAVEREIGSFPENLIVRVSAHMIDGQPPRGFRYTSNVVSDPEDATCIAYQQKNKCDGEIDSCRACWTDKHVSYPLH